MGGGGRQWISLKNGRKISMFKVRGWEGGRQWISLKNGRKISMFKVRGWEGGGGSELV